MNTIEKLLDDATERAQLFQIFNSCSASPLSPLELENKIIFASQETIHVFLRAIELAAQKIDEFYEHEWEKRWHLQNQILSCLSNFYDRVKNKETQP